MKAKVPLFGMIITCAFLVLIAGCGVKVDNPTHKYVSSGPIAKGLTIAKGWQFEGKAIQNQDLSLSDACVVTLPDGRTRIYSNEGSNPNTRFVVSFISSDSLAFEKEPGIRIESPYAFAPYVIILPDGRYRMYMTDQTTQASYNGAIGVKSAISNDGLNFTLESGDRLTYLKTGNEAGGIRGSDVIQLKDGSYRMFYVGLAYDNSQYVPKLLSASSSDGLNWTRDPGVRIDSKMLDPSALSLGNPKPFIDAHGTMHLYYPTVQSDDANRKNEINGIFEATSSDGLNFTHNRNVIVQGYMIKAYYHGNPGDPYMSVEDQMVVMTKAGLRMYFFAFASGGAPGGENGIYSVINRSIR